MTKTMQMRRVMVHPEWLHAHHDTPPEQHGFDFPAKLVGLSTWVGSDGMPVRVHVDSSTGPAGVTAAQHILLGIDGLMAYCDAVFGVQGQGGNVIVAAISGASDGTGGAYHYGCGFGPNGGDWYVDVSPDPRETLGLVMAEVSESYMGLQGKGWNCGGSGGEGLSRFLAEIVSGGPDGSLIDFASGASWTGEDWISRDQGTDSDYPSIGCAVLYLWWLASRGHTVPQIVQAGELGGTLASHYETLTGLPAGRAFSDFTDALAIMGKKPTGDNPWGVATPPYPLPAPAPAPVPVPPTSTPTPAPVPSWWTWVITTAELWLQHLGVMAIPLIERLIELLPLPPVVIAALEELIQGYLGHSPSLMALATKRSRAR